MRRLAEFALRGTWQGGVAVALAMAIPLLFVLAAALAGVVVLRRGLSAAGPMVVSGLGVGMAWGVAGDPTPAVVLAVSVVLAWRLRETVSWDAVWYLAVALAAAVAWGFATWTPAGVEPLVEAVMRQVDGQLSEQFPGVDRQWAVEWSRRLLLAVLASAHLMLALLSLMWARAWQSAMFNPGGFSAELRGFRLPRPLALMLAAVALAGVLGATSVLAWLPLATVPAVFAGVGLVHGAVAKRGLSGRWLVAFYLALFFALPYMVVLLAVLAFFDSWIDFRSRISAAQ